MYKPIHRFHGNLWTSHPRIAAEESMSSFITSPPSKSHNLSWNSASQRPSRNRSLAEHQHLWKNTLLESWFLDRTILIIPLLELGTIYFGSFWSLQLRSQETAVFDPSQRWLPHCFPNARQGRWLHRCALASDLPSAPSCAIPPRFNRSSLSCVQSMINLCLYNMFLFVPVCK